MSDYPKMLIYEEKKFTYWVLVFIPFILGAMVFLLNVMIKDEIWILILPLIFMLFASLFMYNLAFYSIKIFDDKTLQFGFPNWYISLLPHEIKLIEQTGAYRPIRDFGGLGWRLGRKDGNWKFGYLVWLQKGIEIETTKERHYVFGTDNPDEILSLIR